MIYLFVGEDRNKKLSAYEKFVKSLPKETEVFSFSKDNWNEMEIESLYSGSGLFFSKSAVVLSNVLEKEDTREFILEKLPLIEESQNDFIFIEDKLPKAVLDAFKKARAEINYFEEDKYAKKGKEKFNSFLLANALGSKDKLNLWISFRQAVERGVALEELVGVLFWKVKDMILKRNFTKFSQEELKALSARLSYLLPEARSKGPNAEEVFEQFLLEAF